LSQKASLNAPWLVSAKTQAGEDLRLFAVALATVPHADELEVRSTKSKVLHDRRIIMANGSVALSGSSVNGVGKNFTAVLQPDPDVARVYTDSNEAIWADTSVVERRAPGTAAQHLPLLSERVLRARMRLKFRMPGERRDCTRHPGCSER
jgi:hypothetical protein